uniref:Unkown protein n=1 Tax=Riptortus pedestris TaxID=329032 RepID=R4WE22_RIPPE|nr:unkown protein [Riptortus pedestris]
MLNVCVFEVFHDFCNVWAVVAVVLPSCRKCIISVPKRGHKLYLLLSPLCTEEHTLDRNRNSRLFLEG